VEAEAGDGKRHRLCVDQGFLRCESAPGGPLATNAGRHIVTNLRFTSVRHLKAFLCIADSSIATACLNSAVFCGVTLAIGAYSLLGGLKHTYFVVLTVGHVKRMAMKEHGVRAREHASSGIAIRSITALARAHNGRYDAAA
jgi:hypothetical protein